MARIACRAHYARFRGRLAAPRAQVLFTTAPEIPVSLDKDDVRTIAHLARLAVDESRLDALAAELTPVLALVERLNAVDTEGVEPMAHPVSSAMHLRADVVSESDERDALQKPAPAVHEGYFTVPRVIE